MTKVKRELRAPNSHMPQCGVIAKGPLVGWRFAFLRFICIKGALFMDLRCTPPDWPFPQTVRFSMAKDRFELRAVPGERAQRLDAVQLMADAQEHGVSYSPFKE